MMQQTTRFDGKIFVLECGCPERGGYIFGDRCEVAGGATASVVNESLCRCDYYPWIILPKDFWVRKKKPK